MTAAQHGEMLWPNLRHRHKPRLAAENLGRLCLMGLLWKRTEPTNWHKGFGEHPPKHVYYLTDLGFAVYDYWRRQ